MNNAFVSLLLCVLLVLVHVYDNNELGGYMCSSLPEARICLHA
jgi:hypothetical protein